MADNNSFINYGNLSLYHTKNMELLNSMEASLQEQIDDLIRRIKAIEDTSITIVEADSTE